MQKQKISKRNSLIMLGIVIMGLFVIFSYGIGNVSAASNTIYVNGSSGNDSWNGLNATWTSGLNGPKATINNATDTINSDGTIYIANGIYNENNIQINTNMNIIGQSENGTIINAQYLNRIFTINTGVTVTLENLTIEDGEVSYQDGGAIYNSGDLTINKCVFKGNNVNWSGGAIYNLGTLTINNSIFNNNTASGGAGAITNAGYSNGVNLYITNSTLNNNTAKGGYSGGAINNNGNTGTYNIYIANSTLNNNMASGGYSGGAIYNDGNNGDTANIYITNSTLNNNTVTGAYSAGAIYNEANNGGTANIYITNSTLNNNLATNFGSGSAIENNPAQSWDDPEFERPAGTANLYITHSTLYNNAATYNEDGSLLVCTNSGFDNIDMSFNRIYGNNGTYTLTTWNPFNILNTSEIENNWWGSNNPNFNTLLNNIQSPQNWFVLTVNSNPTTIYNSKTSTVTADLTHDNTGALVNGNIPNGTPITFTGTLNPTSTNLINGQAQSLFIAETSGISVITATVDNQSVSTLINITPVSDLYLNIILSKNNLKIGEIFKLTYKLGNKGPDNATNVVVTIPLPNSFVLTGINGDGNWTTNTNNSTITWTLTNVTVGDPYLYVTGKTTSALNSVFNSSITSETYNLNTQGVTPIIITSTNPINPTNPSTPTSPTNSTGLNNSKTQTTTTELNAATGTIPMQHTGVPIAGLIFGILSVLGGTVMSRKK